MHDLHGLILFLSNNNNKPPNPPGFCGSDWSLFHGVTGKVQRLGGKSEEGWWLTPVEVEAGHHQLGHPPEAVGSSAYMWASSKPGGWVPRENPRVPGGNCAAFKNLHLHWDSHIIIVHPLKFTYNTIPSFKGWKSVVLRCIHRQSTLEYVCPLREKPCSLLLSPQSPILHPKQPLVSLLSPF